MNAKMIFGVFLLAAALLLAGNGFRIISDPEGAIRQPGDKEKVKGVPGAIDVSLRAGQTFYFPGSQSNGNWHYCLDWQTEYGPSSVDVSARTRHLRSNAWVSRPGNGLCLKFEEYNIQFTSKRDQVVRFGVYLNRYNNWRKVQGGTAAVCTECRPMKTFDQVSSIPHAKQRGRSQLLLGGIVGGAALVIMIGLTTALSVAYSIMTSIFPSRRARTVRAEMHRASDPFTAYDPKANQGYRDPEESDFRRRQDTDDLADLVAEAKRKLKEAQNELERTQDRPGRNNHAYEQAKSEFDDAVNRAKAAKAKMDSMQARRGR